jgi:hypothetical protein
MSALCQRLYATAYEGRAVFEATDPEVDDAQTTRVPDDERR